MAVQERAKERVEFATQRSHFEKAFQLVYQEYLRKGYCSPNPYQMRYSIFSALPKTVTFCLWRHDHLVGTASVVFDSSLGLPMDDIYHNELENLRKSGRKPCEVSSLALNSDIISKGILPLYFAERLRCLYLIFKPIFWYAKATAKYSDLCIAVNPVHRNLYSSLHFEEFGVERIYQSVNNNSSIAMRLRFDGIEERGKITPGLYKLFLGKVLEIPDISQVFRWNEQDFKYFFIDNSSISKKITPNELEFLVQSYPEILIKKLIEEKRSVTDYGEEPSLRRHP